jgi:amino acid transporter
VRRHHSKLGEFLSTAICGNDIFSTVLYVTGVSALFTGIYAPLVLIAVGAVLFFYRSVYREVMEALPMNGGAYNALLNAASKNFASLAGVMGILAYTATAVISSKTAVEYLFRWIGQMHLLGSDQTFEVLRVWIIPATIIILIAFAIFVVIGVRDSARMAAGIFMLHLAVLTLLIGCGLLWYLTGGVDIWHLNGRLTSELIASHGGLLKALFFGFSISLLGIAGFESSANFIEEQKHGVFHKTLRNMTIGSLLLNPVATFVILTVLPLNEISANRDFILAEVGFRLGGEFLLTLVAIDAFLVLCGAVLTSYIAIEGLVLRMAQDNCLPHFLLNKNLTQSTPRIAFAFCSMCIAVLLLTQGDLLAIAGMYTISFLALMSLFAVGNLYLRKTRRLLERPYRAPFPYILVALCLTLIGLLGNIALDPNITGYFLIYFIPATILVLSVIYRKDLYDTLHKFFSWFPPLHRFFGKKYLEAKEDRIFVFIHHLDHLYHVLDHIKKNEGSTHITFVHCKHDIRNFTQKLEKTLFTLKEAGFFSDFTFEIEYIDEPFSAKLLDRYARQKKTTKNKIFMGSVRKEHDFTYEQLGGVRIVF